MREAQDHEQVGVHRGKSKASQVVLGEVVNVCGYPKLARAALASASTWRPEADLAGVLP